RCDVGRHADPTRRRRRGRTPSPKRRGDEPDPHRTRSEAIVKIEPFYDPATFTLTYVVYDPQSKDAVVIDSVLDYDPLASQTSTASVEYVAAFLKENALRVHWALETHAHADHLSAAPWLKRRFEARTVIGEDIRQVQTTFKQVFDLPADVPTDGSQ